MDYLNHPDYTCTGSSDGNVYCEHSPEASRLGRIVRDCNRGREKLSPVAQTSEAMESHTPVDIPPEPVEVAELSEEIDPTQQMVKFAGCAAMVGREALRSGSDMWYALG